MKINEVKGPEQVTGLKGRDVSRSPQGDAPAGASKTQGPDRLDLAHQVGSTAQGTSSERVQQLRRSLQQGAGIDTNALAQKLRSDGVVR